MTFARLSREWLLVRARRALLTSVVLTAALAVVIGQRSAARAVGLQVCSQDQVASASTDARRVGGDVVGVTALGTWGTVACSLRERLTFAVKPAADRMSAHGLIGSIKGNPGQKVVSTVLKPGRVLVYAWRWRNWCGAGGKFALQGSWSGSGYTAFVPSQSVKPPSCIGKQSGSTLTATRSPTTNCSPSAYRVGARLGQPFETYLIDAVRITLRKGHSPCLLRNTHVVFAGEGQVAGTGRR